MLFDRGIAGRNIVLKPAFEQLVRDSCPRAITLALNKSNTMVRCHSNDIRFGLTARHLEDAVHTDFSREFLTGDLCGNILEQSAAKLVSSAFDFAELPKQVIELAGIDDRVRSIDQHRSELG